MQVYTCVFVLLVFCCNCCYCYCHYCSSSVMDGCRNGRFNLFVYWQKNKRKSKSGQPLRTMARLCDNAAQFALATSFDKWHSFGLFKPLRETYPSLEYDLKLCVYVFFLLRGSSDRLFPAGCQFLSHSASSRQSRVSEEVREIGRTRNRNRHWLGD